MWKIVFQMKAEIVGENFIGFSTFNDFIFISHAMWNKFENKRKHVNVILLILQWKISLLQVVEEENWL